MTSLHVKKYCALFSSLLRGLIACAFMLSMTLPQTLRAQEVTDASVLGVELSIAKLRLNLKEYVMSHDEAYGLAFDKEATHLSLRFSAMSNDTHLYAIHVLEALKKDLKSYEEYAKQIVALERQNIGIEGSVFSKYNALLEELPNKILFQSFNDNDPMSGNSAAYLLDTVLKYKISVASYALHNDSFSLIRARELKGEVDKHASKIEVVVDNKESLKRIKQFKEAFVVYAEGFEIVAKNSEAQKRALAVCFDEIHPRMMHNTLELNQLTQTHLDKTTRNSGISYLSFSLFVGLSFFIGFGIAFFLRKK